MANAVARPRLEFTAAFTIDEGEARFLDALIGYGGKNLVHAVKAHLGKAYIEDHEQDGIRFCDSLRMPLASVLRQFEDARKVFDGTHDAARREARSARVSSEGAKEP